MTKPGGQRGVVGVCSGSFTSIPACPHEVWSLGYSGHDSCPVEGIGQDVIQAPKLEQRTMRYELSDHEWVRLAANYLAFIKLASIRIWLRAYESAP